MSATIRQSNLFGAYTWQIAYEGFIEADYQSYEYDSIYQSMVEYIRVNYSDDFNDYIRHSELMAHVNLLAYLGQAHSLRMDVNNNENFMDDAKRRESIINIASMLTYKAKRAIPFQGYLKITGMMTSENIIDSNGNNLAQQMIKWSQRGDSSWYDSFLKILDSALLPDNDFGKPFKKLDSSIRTEIYQINQPRKNNYTIPFKYYVEDELSDFELVPTDIIDNTMVERHPSPNDPFTIVYKNDSNGNNSHDTGFFVQIKQGKLLHSDFYYDTPKNDRKEHINIPNINDTDVWVHEFDDDMNVAEYWYDIPKDDGQNIIYNEFDSKIRNLFFAKTRNNNSVEIIYGDGSFSKSPRNPMRVTYRQSFNKKIKFRAGDFNDFPIEISYISKNGKEQKLTLLVTQMDDILESTPSETNDEIKRNALLTHYTQQRMVSLSDYNVFMYNEVPLRKFIVKNRDNANKSRYRYIDTHDPTGAHSNVTVVGDDGYLYADYYPSNKIIPLENDSNRSTDVIVKHIRTLLESSNFETFFYNEMFPVWYHNSTISTMPDFPFIVWENSKLGNYNTKGQLVEDDSRELYENDLLIPNARIRFLFNSEIFWAKIISIKNGQIILTDHIPSGAKVELIIPSIPVDISNTVIEQLNKRIAAYESFGLYYDIPESKWKLINQNNINSSTNMFDDLEPISSSLPDNRWIVKCIYQSGSVDQQYSIVCRGSRYVFGSNKQVRFYFADGDLKNNIENNLPVKDHIKISIEDEFMGNDEFIPHEKYLISSKSSNIIYLE